MEQKSHYPSYDVMRQQDHWDDHTQQVVQDRLSEQPAFRFLTAEEVDQLKRLTGDLVDDHRQDIIQYVVGFIDQSLSSGIGEGQRKVGVPKAEVLLRDGLKAINKSAEKKYGQNLLSLDVGDRLQLLEQLSQNGAESVPEWAGISQIEVFKKLLNWSIEAYYSHPRVWSEIGYGGPAYPRGYIRTGIGQLDPWEAQPE